MTRIAAIQNFLSSFDLTAYEEYSVPDDAAMPYLTYSISTDYFEAETPVQVNLWYRTTSNSVPNAKANEIGDALSGGKILTCDDGGIWIKRGSPFCQNMIDENDSSIKRRYINLSAEFIML